MFYSNALILYCNQKHNTMKRILLLLVAVLMFSSFSEGPFRTIGKNIIFEMENPDLSPVEISIKDSENRLVFSEIVKDQEKIGKLFNFEQTVADTYTIKIKDGDTTYEKIVEIN